MLKGKIQKQLLELSSHQSFSCFLACIKNSGNKDMVGMVDMVGIVDTAGNTDTADNPMVELALFLEAVHFLKSRLKNYLQMGVQKNLHNMP